MLKPAKRNKNETDTILKNISTYAQSVNSEYLNTDVINEKINSTSNIEERKRELATIKLLGFYNNELSNYVFRENVILTIIGGFLGLVLGVYLLTFIISTAEMDIVMFGRERAFSSYFFAFVLTMVFAFLINLIMNKELKKIDMIESLKSVE